MKIRFPLFLLPILVVGHSIRADALKGVFDFPERAPYVALVYFADDQERGPELCGDLDQMNKEFEQRMVAGKSGCMVEFRNSDGVQHNIFASDGKNGVAFDIGLLSPGELSSVKVDWQEGSVIRVGCKIHPKMRSYIANVPAKRFAIVEFRDGSGAYEFSIEDVPDGLMEVVVWFPSMDGIMVGVVKGGKVERDITRKGKTYGTLKMSR